MTPSPALMELPANNKPNASFPAIILVVTAVLALITTFEHLTGNGIVDAGKIMNTPPLVVYKTPWKERLSVKRPAYRYNFSFFENPHRYQLHSQYYDYSTGSFQINDLKEGDTIILQIWKDDEKRLHTRNGSTDKIDIVNIIKNDIPYIDHRSRNLQLTKANRSQMLTFLYLFAGALLIATIWPRLKKKWSL